MEILLGQIRMEKNLTLIELEKLSGISNSSLNNYENGKTMPNMLRMEQMAKALCVKIEELYDSECK